MTGQTKPASHPTRTANPPCLAWRRFFPGEFEQVSVVRRWIAELLPECDARDTAVLVASELATNAVRHSASSLPGGRFGVGVTWEAESVRIEVADCGGPKVPAVIEDADGEDGRGLWLVARLSDSLRVSGDEEGRLVRARIPWGADGGPPRRIRDTTRRSPARWRAFRAHFPWLSFGSARRRGAGGWRSAPSAATASWEGLSPGDLAVTLGRIHPAVLPHVPPGHLARFPCLRACLAEQILGWF